jgi:hypothetical protein
LRAVNRFAMPYRQEQQAIGMPTFRFVNGNRGKACGAG